MVGGNTWNNDNKKLLHLIKMAFQNNIPVGAICGAVNYLEHRDVTEHSLVIIGRRATGELPSFLI